MEKKRKLGRSLDDVADLWLSTAPLPSENAEDIQRKPSVVNDSDLSYGFTSRTISLVYPESPKVKALLVSNFALELAKQGYGSCILDYEAQDSPLKPIINTLIQSFSKVDDNGDSSTSHQILKLYGMPSIHFFSKTGENLLNTTIPKTDDNLYSRLSNSGLEESIIILYHQDTLDIINAMDYPPPVVILVTKPKKESLLVCYAYIKTILRKNPHTRIWIVMDEVLDRDVAVKAFTFLNQIIIRRLSHAYHQPKYLGSIIHDQTLGISLATHYPIVLSEQHSIARACLIRITANFIKTLENPD
jgi:hypothetical protein